VRLGQDQESRLLAVGARARVSDQQETRSPVRLERSSRVSRIPCCQAHDPPTMSSASSSDMIRTVAAMVPSPSAVSRVSCSTSSRIPDGQRRRGSRTPRRLPERLDPAAETSRAHGAGLRSLWSLVQREGADRVVDLPLRSPFSRGRRPKLSPSPRVGCPPPMPARSGPLLRRSSSLI
jgi:hypothetical protein